MSTIKGEKIVCCLLAIILLFLGMSVNIQNADSSFLYAAKESYNTETMISSKNYMIEDENLCTLNMLVNNSDVLRSTMTNSMVKGTYRTILSFLIVGSFLQYLFYQSAESREDGQLFLCRTAVVDYIHLKDSGE